MASNLLQVHEPDVESGGLLLAQAHLPSAIPADLFLHVGAELQGVHHLPDAVLQGRLERGEVGLRHACGDAARGCPGAIREGEQEALGLLLVRVRVRARARVRLRV